MKSRFLLAIILCVALVAAACGGDTAHTPSNNEANNVVEDSGNNNTPDMGTLPDEGTPEDTADGEVDCDSNADCTAPQVCVIDLATGDGTCEEPTGTGQTGDMCTTGADCASGLCINDRCADPCQGEADCPAGYTCEPTDVTLDDGSTQTINACVPEIVICASNTDCTDPNVCVVDRSGDDVTLECGGPVGGGAIGDACTADSDCQSNLCLDDTCSAPCETSNDCSDDGSFLCENTTVTTGNGTADLTVCTPRPAETCLSDANCSGGERCIANKTLSDLEFTCGTPNAGGGESGDACTADTDCAQNLCVDDACAGPCETVGDCGGSPLRCEVTMVDIGGGNTDSGQICRQPVPCQEDDGCRTTMNEVCYIREETTGFEPICRNPNVGGGNLGQVCSSKLECANNFCLDTRFRDVCVPPCVDDSDCPVTGYECGTATVDLAAGGSADIDVCVPEPAPACTSDDDCGTGLNCVIIENEAGDALESVCVPTTGGSATGVACTDDSNCGSLVCLNNFCAAPCDDSNQCGQNQLCLSNTIDRNGTTGDFDVCETLPDTQCTSSDDCADGVRVCGQIRDNMGTDEGYCAFPNPTGDQLGTSCTASADCRENICLTGISNECSVICDKNSDCAAAQTCTTYGDLNFCNTACSDNTDCGAPDRYCTINGDVLTDEVDQICVTPIGNGDLGADCTTGDTCLSGLCLETFLFNGIGCTDDGDCAAGETCECPLDDPNCTADKECATSEQRCTFLCDDASDCSGGVADNPLTACSTDTFVSRPSGVRTQISACATP